jgi:uncharacterized protein
MSAWTGGLAFDRLASARSYDLDGRLRIDSAVLSMERVDPYRGDELVNGELLGLHPRRVYLMFRPGVELERAASSANGIPLLSRHQPVDAVDYAPELVCGAVLSDSRYEHPHLVASIAIWAKDEIDGIENGDKGALSAGYRYDPDMTPGVSPSGERYDGSMKNIVFNHVAIVENPRIGSAGFLSDRLADWRIEEKVLAEFRARFVLGY